MLDGGWLVLDEEGCVSNYASLKQIADEVRALIELMSERPGELHKVEEWMEMVGLESDVIKATLYDLADSKLLKRQHRADGLWVGIKTEGTHW